MHSPCKALQADIDARVRVGHVNNYFGKECGIETNKQRFWTILVARLAWLGYASMQCNVTVMTSCWKAWDGFKVCIWINCRLGLHAKTALHISRQSPRDLDTYIAGSPGTWNLAYNVWLCVHVHVEKGSKESSDSTYSLFRFDLWSVSMSEEVSTMFVQKRKAPHWAHST